ncbi:hypothetical protein QG516_03275 [Pedobacter gandavensis]|uniref:hypothetical protein n=1 Tax=Pedobacter gandavensis TaxID=2679963 RepID=UPI0024794880|nr:hypothetical protein [Pedobacter gandavensis]WGQ10675.1 hypothetical protein QG516_03275 [Pedobacter gandavensis]
MDTSENPNEKEITEELLEKSAVLKEKSALLKAQMEKTAMACHQLLKSEGLINEPTKGNATENNQQDS